MQTTGKLINASLDFNTGNMIATLELNTQSLEVLNELNNEKLDVEIKKLRNKRSLNANNYAWKLITEIANVMRMDKEDVYFRMLKCYGQSDMISVLEEIDVSKFLKYYEKAGESILNGKCFSHYKVYMGSSEMNTKQMSILIDGIVEEAKNLGIETMTPSELSRLKEEWK